MTRTKSAQLRPALLTTTRSKAGKPLGWRWNHQSKAIARPVDPRRERLARAMTTHSSRPWEDMNENTRKLHLTEVDRLLAAIDGRGGG